MKIKLYGILLLLCVIACQSKVEKDGETAPSDSLQTDSMSVSSEEVNFATVFLGEKYQYEILPVDKNIFLNTKDFPITEADRIKEMNCEDPAEDCEKKIEKATIEPFAKLVTRQGDSLILKCGTNDSRSVSFVSESSDEGDFSTYSFVHKYTNPDVYLVAGTYWESFDYKIVNRKTCKVMNVIGIPVFSPDRKKAIVTNEDLVAGFTFNGLEVLTFQDTAIVKDASQKLNNWAIEKASWISNQEVKVTQVTANYSSEEKDKELVKRYAIFKIK